MRIHYPRLKITALDREADDRQVIVGAWRDKGIPQDVHDTTGPNAATKEAKR
jgi:hypothetical protein